MTVRFKFLENVPVDNELRVVLGVQTFRLFLTMPKSFHFIGIVKFGMEFGLLAQTHAGDYVRINGSDIETLCKDEIDRAIQLAKVHMPIETASKLVAANEPLRKPNSPRVLQKKYRKIDPSLAKSGRA